MGAFKTAIAKVVRKLSSASRDPILPDGTYDPDFDHAMREAWSTAQRILDQKSQVHGNIDEATALHWVAFLLELKKSNQMIQLPPDMFQKICQIASTTPERLSPSQLVARIVDKWIKENLMADKVGLDKHL